MSLLQFRKKQSPTDTEQHPDPSLLTEAEEYLVKRAGLKTKRRNVSHAHIFEQGSYIFRVQCLDCITTFELFGRFAPNDSVNGESQIVQAIMVHMGQCSDRKHPVSTLVIKHRECGFYKLIVEWLT